jgi:hypothetical protein
VISDWWELIAHQSGNVESETYQFAGIYEFTEAGRLIETGGVAIKSAGEISDRNPGFRELV